MVSYTLLHIYFRGISSLFDCTRCCVGPTADMDTLANRTNLFPLMGIERRFRYDRRYPLHWLSYPDYPQLTLPAIKSIKASYLTRTNTCFASRTQRFTTNPTTPIVLRWNSTSSRTAVEQSDSFLIRQVLDSNLRPEISYPVVFGCLLSVAHEKRRENTGHHVTITRDYRPRETVRRDSFRSYTQDLRLHHVRFFSLA